MNIKKVFFTKPRLIVNWTPNALSLLRFDTSAVLRYESFFLQEASFEELSAKAASFLGISKIKETLLILPRSEVLQKELSFIKSKNPEEIKGMLETRLSQLLPYSPREMAYGLVLNEEAEDTRGLLYAITEKKLQEILNFMGKLGIRIDDIISEDQALCWIPTKSLVPPSPVLRMDQTEERILFALTVGDKICGSRSLLKNGEDFKALASEISFSLLEFGQNPAKVLLSGDWTEEEIETAGRQFSVVIEKVQASYYEGKEIPGVLSGAQAWGKFPLTSLLPSEQKIKKWRTQQTQLFQNSLAAVAMFLSGCLLFGACHLLFLNYQRDHLEKEAEKISLQIKGVRSIALSLDKIHQSDNSKKRLLRLMRELAEKIPPAVRLKELQIEEKEIMFRGESPSHALLSQSVQAFERTDSLHLSKLEHTRMRKRLGQEYLEFEVSAQWKN